MKKYWELVRNYFPIFGLVLVVAVFGIVTKGAILSAQNLQSIHRLSVMLWVIWFTDG